MYLIDDNDLVVTMTSCLVQVKRELLSAQREIIEKLSAQREIIEKDHHISLITLS